MTSSQSLNSIADVALSTISLSCVLAFSLGLALTLVVTLDWLAA